MSDASLRPSLENDEWNQAKRTAHEAVACGSEMAGHAISAVGAMASQATCDVGKKADGLVASAGVGIQGLSDSFSENAPRTGILGSASQSVARSVHGGGEYLEGAKLTGMAEDIAQLIRRHPIPAILIAVGLGWFVSRTLRS